MNFDRNKTFPYPVLRPYSDDYCGVEFQATPEVTIDGNNIGLACTYLTSATELLEQVQNGSAKFVSVVSCRDTYFRKTYATDKDTAVYSLDANTLRGEVAIESYIVCTSLIEGFTSPDINPEFGRSAFTFTPGQVLAQEETKVVYIDRDLFKPLSSVFELVKNESVPPNEWRVALDSNHVQIQVSPGMKEAIDDARNNTAKRAVLLNSLYMGAVTQAVQALKERADVEDNKWAEVMLRQLQNQDLELDKTEAYLLAQRLMKHPLGVLRAYVLKETV